MDDELKRIGKLQVEKQKLREIIRKSFKEELTHDKHGCLNEVIGNSLSIFTPPLKCKRQKSLHRSDYCVNCDKADKAHKHALKMITIKKSISLKITFACKRIIKQEQDY